MGVILSCGGGGGGGGGSGDCVSVCWFVKGLGLVRMVAHGFRDSGRIKLCRFSGWVGGGGGGGGGGGRVVRSCYRWGWWVCIGLLGRFSGCLGASWWCLYFFALFFKFFCIPFACFWCIRLRWRGSLRL